MYADMQQLFGYKYVKDVYGAVIYLSNVIAYSSTNWLGDLANSVVCSAWREHFSGIILYNNNGKLSRVCMHLSTCVSTACYSCHTFPVQYDHDIAVAELSITFLLICSFLSIYTLMVFKLIYLVWTDIWLIRLDSVDYICLWCLFIW